MGSCLNKKSNTLYIFKCKRDDENMSQTTWCRWYQHFDTLRQDIPFVEYYVIDDKLYIYFLYAETANPKLKMFEWIDNTVEFHFVGVLLFMEIITIYILVIIIVHNYTNISIFYMFNC